MISRKISWPLSHQRYLLLKTFLRSLVYFAFGCIILPGVVNAQAYNDSSGATTHPLSSKNLFDTDELFTIRLTGNIRELMNDRSDNPESHPLLLSYKNEKGNEISFE